MSELHFSCAFEVGFPGLYGLKKRIPLAEITGQERDRMTINKTRT